MDGEEEVVTLAGFKRNSEYHQRVKRDLESQGKVVKTYNTEYGMADSTNIYAAARGASEIVNMARNTPDNRGLHELCARVAGKEGATLTRR